MVVAGTVAVFEVFVTDANGTPVPDAPVSFAVDGYRSLPIPIADLVRTRADGRGRLEIQVPYTTSAGQMLIRVGQTTITARLETYGANSRCYFVLTVVPAA